MKKLTANQKFVLKYLEANNIRVVQIRGIYQSVEDFKTYREISDYLTSYLKTGYIVDNSGFITKK